MSSSPDVAICWAMGDTVPSTFVRQLLAQKNPRVGTYAYVQMGPDLAMARNILAGKFLATDMQVCVMIDTDIVWTPDQLEQLLACPADIAIASYPDSNGKRVTEGMGFTAIRRDVFNYMDEYPFSYIADEHGHMGEDVSFLYRARQAGRSIEVLDFTVKHAKLVEMSL